jgi:hypothetical protein
MKKLLVIALCALCSCSEPVLDKGEYVIVDTLNVSRNGFGKILEYEVIVEIDSSYHYGTINVAGELTYVNIKKIKKEIK